MVINKFVLIVTFLFSGFYCSVVAGEFKTETLRDSALYLLVRQNYKETRVLLENYLQKYPQNNEALYLKFALEQTRILDYESYMLENDVFQTYADSTKRIFENRLKVLEGHDSIECLFYIANIYGGVSIMQAKTGNWFDAVKNALASVSLLKQVKNNDPENYAAYLGIGVFNYYLSNSFKWLPFVEQRGQEGVKSVEQALKADFPYNYAAKNSLCWILIEKKEFARADSLAQTVLKDMPSNTIFLRIRALIALWTGKYSKAIELSKQLIIISEKRDPLNWSDLVTGYNVLVNSYGKLKMEREAVAAAEKINKKKIPENYLQIPHIKKNMRYINDIRQKSRFLASDR